MSDDTFYLRAFGAAMTRDEREFLKDTAKAVEDLFPLEALFVNIGVFHGCSMHCLRAGVQAADIIGIDVDYSRDIERKDLLTHCKFVEADSAEYGKLFGLQEVHLLFIDGDHRYKQVAADIEAWVPHVNVDGVMIFHDYNPKQVDLNRDPTLRGVREAVGEWRVTSRSDGWTMFAEVDSMIGFRRNE